MLSLCQWTLTHAPHWRALSVNGAALHEGGASPAQELAFMAARAVSYLRPLVQKHGVTKALALIDVRLAADQDAHFNIIKFRAARLIWRKIAHEFGANPDLSDLPIHAVSSMRMFATQDPWPNIVRLNSACFGAVCGGANYITLLPFTRPIGLPTGFARRLSRNIQLLHREETHLGHVHDPAHGSYMHESLTHELAQKSWSIFQGIEERGGWFTAFDGFMETVKQTEKTRNEKIQSGEALLVGINQFVKEDVRTADVLPRPVLKPRSGKTRSGKPVQADHFPDAIAQIKAGNILPFSAGEG
jgi:methylmalonyl-CoA mutase